MYDSSVVKELCVPRTVSKHMESSLEEFANMDANLVKTNVPEERELPLVVMQFTTTLCSPTVCLPTRIHRHGIEQWF